MHGRGGGAEGRGRRWGSLALAAFAAVLLAFSVFMPRLDSATVQLHDNRLIDGWEGVVLIGCAVLVILGAGLGLRRRRWGWLHCAAGTAALGVVIYASTGSRLIVQKGPLEGAIYADRPGIGLVVAGLGALVAIGAGLTIGLARDVGGDSAARLSQMARP